MKAYLKERRPRPAPQAMGSALASTQLHNIFSGDFGTIAGRPLTFDLRKAVGAEQPVTLPTGPP